MKASVILAHPHEGSFNHAIYMTINETLKLCGVIAFSHDLYKEKFDPVLTGKELGTDISDDVQVNRYVRELVESDILFFVHPNWWGQPPAILKGYIDRVIRPPHAYDFPDKDSEGGLPVQKLCGKYGIVYNTSNTGADREDNYFGDPLERIWKQCVFGFCGITRYHRRMFRVVADSNYGQRTAWIDEVRKDVVEAVDIFKIAG
ncbi:MAG TPA: NAD(P)H dehydrogenase [Fibrobacteres bacterium]|nr:NAD(P)H dehydrogenase [Fibrobacterota bacterium]